MISFIIVLLVLCGGSVFYGRYGSRVFDIDKNRPTPVQTMDDGVDYVLLPTWKISLIQFLNIAVLWRYFAWCNQELSVFTLWSLTVYLASKRRNYYVTLIPALFMTCVTTTYIYLMRLRQYCGAPQYSMKFP